MARKRKRRARRFKAAPLLVAAVLLGVVVWAIYPRHHKPTPAHVAPAVPAAQATAEPSAQASPIVAAAASPSPAATAVSSPSTAPGASTAPSASPAVAATVNPNGPQVAIIIDDSGQWIDTERGFLALPIPLTMAVLPHVRYTSTIAQEAAAAGKGVMLHLPMEPLSHINPGPGEIKTGMNDRQVTSQTEDDVAQVPLAKGVNNHEGSEASANARVMQDVMGVIKAHDLFFVDSMTNSRSVGTQTAQSDGVPTASRDVFLDNQATVAYTESALEETVRIAKRNGSAIAIGHPKPTTLQALRDMYPKMQAEGVRFVLAEQLVR